MHSYHPSTCEAKEHVEGVQELLGQRGCIASKCLKNNQTKEIQKKELHTENLHFGEHLQSIEKQII